MFFQEKPGKLGEGSGPLESVDFVHPNQTQKSLESQE